MRELKCEEMSFVSGGADEESADDSVLETVVETISEVFEDISIAVVGLPQHVTDLIEYIKDSVKGPN